MKILLDLGRVHYFDVGWSKLHEFAVLACEEKLALSSPELEKSDYSVLYNTALSGMPFALERDFGVRFDYESEQLGIDISDILFECVADGNEIGWNPKCQEEQDSALINDFNMSATASRAGIQLNRFNPISVVRNALILLERSANGSHRWPQVSWAIHLLGWATVIQKFQTKCAFCPRLADLGKMYCEEHSQASNTSNPKEKSLRAQRYKWGRRARAIADRWLLMAPYEHKAWPNDGGAYLDDIGRQRFLQALIEPPYHEALGINRLWIMSHLIVKILDSKRVMKKLGGRKKILEIEDVDKLVDWIIGRLNPFQRRLDFLETVVESFELWFYLEELARRGSRRKGDLAETRIKTAIKLAARGARQREIARACDVGESTVSGWVKRDVALNKILARKKLEKRKHIAAAGHMPPPH